LVLGASEAQECQGKQARNDSDSDHHKNLLSKKSGEFK
jgi:hypothetical protein